MLVEVTSNRIVINGDLAVDPDSFEGIKKRVSNMPSRMTINIDASNDGTGAETDILASTATQHKFLDALHRAVKYVMGSSNDKGKLLAIGNEESWLGIGQVARRLNLYSQIEDPYGKTWDAIAGIRILDIGLKSDLTTEIITNTENPGDGGTDSTSLYLVRTGGNGGLQGIQLKGTSPMAYDPLSGGEMETKPSKLRRIDWAVGLANLSQFCIARIKGYSVSA